MKNKFFLAATLASCFASLSVAATVMADPPNSSFKTVGDAQPPGTGCRIVFVKPHFSPEPHSPKPEAPQVEAILQSMIKAYGEGDLPAYAKFLDENCSRLDERSKKMIEGKSAIVANLKELFASHAKGGSEPLVSFTVDQPYIKVTGDMAVATFWGVQETGGSTPSKAQGLVTYVFAKLDGVWKLTRAVVSLTVAPKPS